MKFIRPAKGYSNGVLAEGKLLFVAGQIGTPGDFVEQFGRALDAILEIVREAGGKPEHLARFTMYVADKQEYLGRLRDVGAAYRERMGRHFPAMALVEVKSLLEPGAKVEIEATAVIP